MARIDGWYEELPDHWLIEHLPPFFLRRAMAGLVVWQVVAVPLLLVLAWLVAVLASRVTCAIARRLAQRTTGTWDDALVERLRGPATLGWLVAIIFLAKPFLTLPTGPSDLLVRALRAVLLVVVFWTVARTIEIMHCAVAASQWIATRAGTRALLPVISRVARVAVFGFAVVALLSELGYPVASIIAGLGVGGLAVALAAQKTIENLFGAFAIGADQPFREGDFVKVEDFVGTVESIGLRSTRIRTLDRTIISLPNGKLADMRLESFTARERMRLATTIGLVYETSAEQLRQVLSALEATLRAHPKIWPDAVVVRFSALGATSLDIEIMAWFQTPDWGEFQLIRQDVLMQFMDVVQKAGTSFAFPTQSIHLIRDNPQ
ncbi:MAG: mechanosensitive ion channel family protein [Clostridia bacterium]|nr:mechanosensitive ion channel family protein [Deltaproteobacteria bacterium]